VTIRVLIADDHGILRAGLHAILSAEPDIEVVGEAGDSDEVLRLATQLKPNIILLDVSMPGRDGIDTTRMLREQGEGVHVIILTVHEEYEILQGAVQAGASGYVVKRAAKSELMNAIHSAMKGDFYAYPSLTRDVMASSQESMPVLAKMDGAEPSDHLTRREVEVLKLIANGYTNNQVADQLKISVRTVEFHRANLMNKLHLESRVGLMRYAVEHGFIDLNKLSQK